MEEANVSVVTEKDPEVETENSTARDRAQRGQGVRSNVRHMVSEVRVC